MRSTGSAGGGRSRASAKRWQPCTLSTIVNPARVGSTSAKASIASVLMPSSVGGPPCGGQAATGSPPAGASRWSSELPGLVIAGGLPDDDVHAVIGVDEGDDRHQRDELVIVVVLDRVRPGLIADASPPIGDAGALLGELQ